MMRIPKPTQRGLIVLVSLAAVVGFCIFGRRSRGTATPTLAIRLSELALYSVAFSPTGTELAAAGASGVVELIEVPSGRRIRQIESGDEFVYCLAFSPQGTYLASGSREGAVQVWEYVRCKPAMQLMAQASVTDIAFLAGGEQLAIRTIDGMTAVYNIFGAGRSPKVLGDASVKELGRSRFTGRLLIRSRDGRYCAEGFEDGKIELRDFQDCRFLRSWKAHSDQVNCITFSPDSRLMVSGGGFTDHPVSVAGGHPQVCIWTIPGGVLIAKLVWHREAITSVAVSDDGQWVATVDMAGWLCLWNLRHLGTQAEIEKRDAVAERH